MWLWRSGFWVNQLCSGFLGQYSPNARKDAWNAFCDQFLLYEGISNQILKSRNITIICEKLCKSLFSPKYYSRWSQKISMFMTKFSYFHEAENFLCAEFIFKKLSLERRVQNMGTKKGSVSRKQQGLLFWSLWTIIIRVDFRRSESNLIFSFEIEALTPFCVSSLSCDVHNSCELWWNCLWWWRDFWCWDACFRLGKDFLAIFLT